MTQPYLLEFTVRDYELDQYGVVNNAVYQHYLEHTRHEFLLSIGIEPAAIAETGRALALSRIAIRYAAPLRSRDRFQVGLAVSRLTGVRVEFQQRILRLPEETLILDATVEALFLDDRGRPMRIPEAHLPGLRSYLTDAESGGGDGTRP